MIDTSGMSGETLRSVLEAVGDDLGVRAPSAVVVNSRNDVVLSSSDLPELAIHQRVYFAALEEGVVFERYFVNGHEVVRDLLRYDESEGAFK